MYVEGETNSKYGWTSVRDVNHKLIGAKTTYLEDKEITPIADYENLETSEDVTWYRDVEIQLKVIADPQDEDLNIINLAEMTSYGYYSGGLKDSNGVYIPCEENEPKVVFVDSIDKQKVDRDSLEKNIFQGNSLLNLKNENWGNLEEKKLLQHFEYLEDDTDYDIVILKKKNKAKIDIAQVCEVTNESIQGGTFKVSSESEDINFEFYNKKTNEKIFKDINGVAVIPKEGAILEVSNLKDDGNYEVKIEQLESARGQDKLLKDANISLALDKDLNVSQNVLEIEYEDIGKEIMLANSNEDAKVETEEILVKEFEEEQNIEIADINLEDIEEVKTNEEIIDDIAEEEDDISNIDEQENVCDDIINDDREKFEIPEGIELNNELLLVEEKGVIDKIPQENSNEELDISSDIRDKWIEELANAPPKTKDSAEKEKCFEEISATESPPLARIELEQNYTKEKLDKEKEEYFEKVIITESPPLCDNEIMQSREKCFEEIAATESPPLAHSELNQNIENNFEENTKLESPPLVECN